MYRWAHHEKERNLWRCTTSWHHGNNRPKGLLCKELRWTRRNRGNNPSAQLPTKSKTCTTPFKLLAVCHSFTTELSPFFQTTLSMAEEDMRECPPGSYLAQPENFESFHPFPNFKLQDLDVHWRISWRHAPIFISSVCVLQLELDDPYSRHVNKSVQNHPRTKPIELPPVQHSPIKAQSLCGAVTARPRTATPIGQVTARTTVNNKPHPIRQPARYTFSWINRVIDFLNIGHSELLTAIWIVLNRTCRSEHSRKANASPIAGSQKNTATAGLTLLVNYAGTWCAHGKFERLSIGLDPRSRSEAWFVRVQRSLNQQSATQ